MPQLINHILLNLKYFSKLLLTNWIQSTVYSKFTDRSHKWSSLDALVSSIPHSQLEPTRVNTNLVSVDSTRDNMYASSGGLQNSRA